MEELQLTKELYLEIVNWMHNKYSYNTMKVRASFLRRIFKKFRVLDHSNLKKIMREVKHQTYRSSLSMINNYCYENNIDFSIRVPGIKKQANKLPDILSGEEIELMIKSAPKPYDLVIRCIFNMGAGLRISEVIKLSWNHIRWVDWLSNQDNYGVVNIKSGKGMKDRIVNIPKKLMQDLYSYAKEQGVLNEFRIPSGGMIFPFGYNPNKEKLTKKDKYMQDLFTTDQETWKEEFVKMRYDWFRYNIIEKCCEKALNKRIKVHSLRHCVSGDTEILTLNGWKKYNEIKIGDKIFSYNIDKNYIERDKINKINIYDYDGLLDNIKNRYIDSLITSEHKVVIKEITRDYNPNKYELKKFKDLNQKTWNISHKLSSKLINGNLKIGLAKAGILGLILSDGRISNRRNPSISISQSYTSNKDKCDKIERLLKESGIKYTRKETMHKKGGFAKKDYIMYEWHILKGGDHSVKNKGKLHNWIYIYINKDRTPKIENILSLSYGELKSIYGYMLLGDGTKRNYNSREYCGQNENRIELIRILGVLLGHTTSLAIKKQNNKIYYRTHISEEKDYTQLSKNRKHFSKKYYFGKVWCPETKNQTFIAKRNNKIFITGNSRATYLYEIEKVPIEKIQMLLGHNSLDTTRIYTRINPRSIFDSLKDTKEV